MTPVFSPGPYQTIADALYAAYNAHDIVGVSALYAEDGWHEEVNSGRRRLGRQAIAEGLAGFFRMVPDAVWIERERVHADRASAIHYTLTGHIAKDAGPREARSRAVTLRGLHVLEHRDGLLTGTRDFWSMADFLQQID